MSVAGVADDNPQFNPNYTIGLARPMKDWAAPDDGTAAANGKRTISMGPRSEREVGMGVSDATTSIRLDQALEQIRAARSYTLEMLGDLEPGEWFEMPGGVTHIAWQVGHLAMAQYRLCLDRIRGERPDDSKLISLAMLTIFGKGSTPDAAQLKYPPVDDIRLAFERVHRATLVECAKLKDTDLDAAPLKPHRLFNTKIGSLQWCARHEMLHAGQIALLRRMLGRKPIW
ncbi:MAG: DinB family protein [Pirellulales bacterium]